MLSRVSAYVLAGIPAAIGVAFVARYAFVTSDHEQNDNQEVPVAPSARSLRVIRHPRGSFS